MATGDVKNMRVLLLFWSGLLLHGEFLTKCDFKDDGRAPQRASLESVLAFWGKASAPTFENRESNAQVHHREDAFGLPGWPVGGDYQLVRS
jgi:hypothetical protein